MGGINQYTFYRYYGNEHIYPNGMIIYKIINKVNGKLYIGQTNDFRIRFKWHRKALRGGYHSSQKLQRSYDKHGIDSFIIEIIEMTTIEEINKREDHWIEKYQTLNPKYGYNSNAKSIPHYGKRTIEQRTNMSKAQLGKKATPEARLNMSLARKGRFIGKDSPKARAVIQYDLDMNEIASYDSITQAETFTGANGICISNNAKNNAHTAGGYIWKYKKQLL